MIRLIDRVDECADGDYDAVDLDKVSLIWIHRIGRSAGSSAAQIAEFFIHGEGAPYTGSNMAYTYVNGDEFVEQALPFNEAGAHARRWGNAYGVGFAQIGDFNTRPPESGQWRRAVEVCADLVPFLAPHTAKMMSLLPEHLRLEIPVVGHGEVPTAFGANSGKDQPHGKNACPGRLWDMDRFRDEVRQTLRGRATAELINRGHRFSR
ncbi:MAG: peptidoglycan recognition protein family protein [Gammaproteobacteria bacterium]|nr:peptidoglycan recognition protein family protein [Gammaproteobacteria bacterium]